VRAPLRLGLALAASVALALAAAPSGAAAVEATVRATDDLERTRTITIHYRAHNGKRRAAHVLVPAWYGPGANPPIPLIISPHGRGLTGRQNAAVWGNLPAQGLFAVVNPDGHGRRLPLHSWGYPGQVDDLARMPEILARTLPWLKVDRSQVYAFGGSMGGQEVLLLAARYPSMLAGVAAFDSVADFGLQYRRFPRLVCGARCFERYGEPLGRYLQRLARAEIGGTPATAAGAYRARSPLAYARKLAFSCVPIQLWWSIADRIVVDQETQSRRLAEAIRVLNPEAQVYRFAGFWIHTAEMHHRAHLPRALWTFGLLPPSLDPRPPRLYEVVPPPPTEDCVRRG